ncbi:protein ILRUN-like [Amphibalanus amphitrite]|uniref:protein ILRUN-like n=1 Tax=Amphibalanus amphitrite TaxID=1232801 RepID=UPI001C927176|nr:protein ILRUN-like [Amphibalanus amphitrite]XP_043239250.1 protein ILRUN-like [Amphibalanus amphitrite]
MEVDESDVDSVLQQFSCMGTTDRDVLISQFHKLVGDGANERDAAFYLEMNNWNLQEAVGAYFDLQSGPVQLLPPPSPSLVLIEDATVGEGESVPPDTTFIKTWRIKNAGREPWPPGCVLRFLHGSQLSEKTFIPLSCLAPDEVAEVCVQMRSPGEPGMYQSKWRATTASGSHFGDVIWVILTVQHDGVLAVTQQMTRLTELGTSPTAGSPVNPFGEPDGRPRPHGLPAFSGVNAPGRPPPTPPPHTALQPEHACELPNTDAEMD